MAGSMECGCVCDVGDYDPAEVSSAAIHRARKTYKCSECNEEIKPGEQYEYTWGKWDGEQQVFRTCIPCMRIRNDLCKCGWLFGELRDTLLEVLGMDYVTGRTQDEEEE